MRDLFIAMSILGALPMVLVRPHLGILIWSWVAFMLPHRLGWGFTYEFRFALIIAIVTIGSWLISREPKRLPLTWITSLLLLLALWISITTIFAVVPGEAFIKWETSIKILVMSLLTIILMRNRERLHALIWVTVAGLGFFGLKGGLFTLVEGGSHRVYGPEGFFGDNNALALALIMTLPLMRYLQLQSRVRWVRWGLSVLMLLTGVSIIGTYSRGAFIGGAAMLLFLVIKSRRRLLLTAALAVSMTFAYQFMPAQWFERMETITSFEEDASAMGRLYSWEFAYKVALENPILGGGFKVTDDQSLYLSYVPQASHARSTHSVYFEVLGTQGFVGLAIFILLLLVTYWTGGWIVRHTQRMPDLMWARDLAQMTQVSLIGYAVAGTFQNLAFFDLYYQLVCFLVITKLLVQEALAKASAKAIVPAAMDVVASPSSLSQDHAFSPSRSNAPSGSGRQFL